MIIFENRDQYRLSVILWIFFCISFSELGKIVLTANKSISELITWSQLMCNMIKIKTFQKWFSKVFYLFFF